MSLDFTISGGGSLDVSTSGGGSLDVTLQGGGSQSITLQGSGELSFSISGGGELSVNIAHGYNPTWYEGEYTVTPTSSEQVLPTAVKTMRENLRVAPIPSNYGLITWNGTVITVS